MAWRWLHLPNRTGSIVKRQKERARQERQKLKLEKKAQRSADRSQRPVVPGEDPDLAGMVAGPQPRPVDE